MAKDIFNVQTIIGPLTLPQINLIISNASIALDILQEIEGVEKVDIAQQWLADALIK